MMQVNENGRPVGARTFPLIAPPRVSVALTPVTVVAAGTSSSPAPRRVAADRYHRLAQPGPEPHEKKTIWHWPAARLLIW